MDARLAGQAPEDGPAPGPRAHLRQWQLCLTIPEHRLPGTPQLPERVENAGERVLHVPLGALFDAIVTRAHKPDGDFPPDMAALDFRFNGLARSLPHEAQRLCGHRALPPPPEAIIALPRILDTLISDEPRLRPRTQIDPMMPVPVVAGQPGCFQGEDGADTPCTHGRQQLTKAWALVASRPTPAHVLSDHNDVGKAQLAGLIRAGIVPPLALGMGADVMARGLADKT